VIQGCLDSGVGVLTLFAFSQENWQRPAVEVDALMGLLEEYIAREVDNLRARSVSVRVLGDLERLLSVRGAQARCLECPVARAAPRTAGGGSLLQLLVRPLID
jgi:undecaprenyl diphosphate synthase